MAENDDLKWALDERTRRDSAYKLYEDYYEGRHRLDFVPADFRREFADLLRQARLNMCPAVVSAVRDRLKITGLTPDTEADKVADEISQIWRRNRMDARAGDVHREALTTGDCFVIVGENPATNLVTLYPNRARLIVARYDEDDPDRMLFAAKVWQLEDRRVRATLYYPDRVEKYVTRAANRGGELKAGGFVPYESDAEPAVMMNPYDEVPVFHFSCQSELSEAVPVQNMLNKVVRDIVIGGETHSLPQRYALGVEVQHDENGRPVNTWVPGDLWVSRSEKAAFGQLPAADLAQLQAIKEGFKADMATATGIPVTYFNPGTGTPPSGEALKTMEFRLASKVSDHQTNFGDAWEATFRFALKVAGRPDVELDAVWKDTTPRDQTAHQARVIEKMEKRIITRKQAQIELEYTDEEIERMAQEESEVEVVTELAGVKQ